MFSRRKTPRQYAWEELEPWLVTTEERMRYLLDKRHSALKDAEQRGDVDRAERGRLSPKDAFQEVAGIVSIRETLIRNGWLPPREQDVRERRGAGGGTLIENNPTKWALNRAYSRDDLPPGARDAVVE